MSEQEPVRVFSDLSPDAPSFSPSSEIEDEPNLATSTVQSQDVADFLHQCAPYPVHIDSPDEMPAQPPQSHIVFNPQSAHFPIYPAQPPQSHIVFNPQSAHFPIYPAQPPQSHIVFNPHSAPYPIYPAQPPQSHIVFNPHSAPYPIYPAQPPQSHIVFNPQSAPSPIYPAQPPQSHIVFNPHSAPYPIYPAQPPQSHIVFNPQSAPSPIYPAQPPQSHIVMDPCLAPFPEHQESPEELAKRLSTLDFTEQVMGDQPEVPLRIQHKDNKADLVNQPQDKEDTSDEWTESPEEIVFVYFQRFIKNFRKTYSNMEEYKMRYQIFKNTYNLIQEVNARYPNADPPYMINTYADRKRDEMAEYLDGFIYVGEQDKPFKPTS